MIFDVTLIGFDASTNETDHLVKWIKAPSTYAVELFCDRFDIDAQSIHDTGHPDTLNFEDGVDVVINCDGSVLHLAGDKTWALQGQAADSGINGVTADQPTLCMLVED